MDEKRAASTTDHFQYGQDAPPPYSAVNISGPTAPSEPLLQGSQYPPGQAQPSSQYPPGQVQPNSQYPPGQVLPSGGYPPGPLPPYNHTVGLPNYPVAPVNTAQPIGFAPHTYSNTPNYAPYPQTNIYVQQQQPTPALGTTVHFNRNPITVSCPHCRYHGLTRIETQSGCLAWLLCCLLCLFGLGFGCCLIPFCVNSAKNVVHKCASCGRRIGYYAPL